MGGSDKAAKMNHEHVREAGGRVVTGTGSMLNSIRSFRLGGKGVN